MNYNGKEHKINNYKSHNYSNIIYNINCENEQIKSKCENLFNSYDILKLILCPNITKEKNQFMDMFIDIIKSQIKIFINILSLNEPKKVYEIINKNNQNLSKQITEMYNTNNIILSKKEIKKMDNNINSILNNKNKKFHSFKSQNNYRIEDNHIKIKLEQINTKIQDSPIKIEIKDHNNNCLPIELSTPISPYAFKTNKNKNKVFNLQTFNTNNNNNQKIKTNSSLSDFKTNSQNKKNKHKIHLEEYKKRNLKYNTYNESFLFTHSLSNLNKKRRKNDCSPNSNSNNKINASNSKNRIQTIKKYQNVESEVALFLKRENEFNKRNNRLLNKKKNSQSNSKNKKIINCRVDESQDFYRLLPNSLKQPLDDFIKKQQEYIFEEVASKK